MKCIERECPIPRAEGAAHCRYHTAMFGEIARGAFTTRPDGRPAPAYPYAWTEPRPRQPRPRRQKAEGSEQKAPPVAVPDTQDLKPDTCLLCPAPLGPRVRRGLCRRHSDLYSSHSYNYRRAGHQPLSAGDWARARLEGWGGSCLICARPLRCRFGSDFCLRHKGAYQKFVRDRRLHGRPVLSPEEYAQFYHGDRARRDQSAFEGAA
jgi:hypothetical protein